MLKGDYTISCPPGGLHLLKEIGSGIDENVREQEHHPLLGLAPTHLQIEQRIRSDEVCM